MDVLVKESHSTDLLVYLYRLYHQKSLCDVVVHSYDGGSFQAHKIVLTSSSEYLHKIFLNGPSLSTITLDISSAVLQVLLEFSYTGQLFVSKQLHFHVQQAASFLQMYSVLDLLKSQADAQLNPSRPSTVPATQGTQGPAEGTSKGPISSADLQQLGNATDLERQLKQGRNSQTFVKKEGTPRNSDSNSFAEAYTQYPSDRGTQQAETKVKKSRKSTGEVSEDDKKPKRKRKAENTLNGLEKKTKVSKLTGKRKGKAGTTSKRAKSKQRKTRSSRKGSVKGSTLYRGKAGHLPEKNLCQCADCGVEFSAFARRHCHTLKSHPKKHIAVLMGKYLLEKYKKSARGEGIKISEKRISCGICGKHYTRYSLYTLHYSKCHRKVCERRCHLLRFVSKRSKNIPFLKPLPVVRSKKKIRSTKRKTGPKKKTVKKVKIKVERKKAKPKVKKLKLPKARQADDTFECCECRRRLVSQYALFKHLRFTHHKPEEEARMRQFNVNDELRCEVRTCTFTSSNLGQMQDHVRSRHPFIHHNCTQCKAEFQVALLLRRHIATSHDNICKKRHECDLCGVAFPKVQGLRRHQYWKHDIPHSSVKVFECSYPGCGYKTSASSSIKNHQSKHRKDKPFTCEHCGMKLKTELSHKKHVNKMHLGIRPYLCQICGASFGEDHELKSHFLNRHTTDREYQCEYCPYATAVKGTFHTHLFNVHKVQAEDDKRKVYKCPQCPFISVLRHRYRTHLNSHMGKREYVCKVCGKAFISSGTLRTHVKWMHSDKVYSCTQCDYQTKTGQKLSEHIRVQHQLKGFFPYRCPYCDFKCATGGNTRKHVKQVHKNYEVRYLRDDEMLAAARMARASGHHSSLADMVGTGSVDTRGNRGNIRCPSNSDDSILQIIF